MSELLAMVYSWCPSPQSQASGEPRSSGRHRLPGEFHREHRYHRHVSTVEVSPEILAAAEQEAVRQGVEVSTVIDEAVRRFVGGTDLHRLLDEFRADVRVSSTEAEAMRVANEELAAMRQAPRANA